MEIFGIGPLELLLIVLIALIVLGPKEMMKSAQKAAAWLRKLRNSEIWSSTKEVMDIPNQVLHESGLDKEIQELQSLSRQRIPAAGWQPSGAQPSAKKTEDGAVETATEGSPDSTTAPNSAVNSPTQENHD